MKKRHLATMTAMVLAGALLAGCSSGTAATEAAKAPQSSQAGTEKGTEDTAASDTQDGSGASEINRKLFFCPKSVGFDYWTSAEKGIMEAAKTLGYDAVFNGGPVVKAHGLSPADQHDPGYAGTGHRRSGNCPQ